MLGGFRPAGSSDPEAARKARKRASDDHPRRSAMADQALVARASGSSDCPADHFPARLRGSQDGGPQSVFRIPALENGYLEHLRLALEDLGLSDAQIKLSIRGSPSYRGIWSPYKEWCCDHNRYVFSHVSFDCL